MSKMRIFKFWNENGDEKEKEALSLKKAVMSVQGDYKDKLINDGFDVVQQPFPLNPMMARAQLITYDESTNTYDGGSDPRGGGVVYKI